jgi:hypothetical protein
LTAEEIDKLTAEEAAAKVTEAIDAFTKQRVEYATKFREATAEERVELRKQAPDPAALAGLLRKVAEAFPQSAAEHSALAWIAGNRPNTEDFEFAFDTLLAHHPNSEELPRLVLSLARARPSAEVQGRFDTLLGLEDASKELRGMTHYAYLNYQKTLERLHEMLADEESAAQIKNAFGEDGVAYLKTFTPPNEEQRLKELEKIAADYSDVEIRPGSTLGSVLEGEIFEIKYLGIGKTAPDIDGEDIDGTPFKLSDYRGKVVVIDFWGDW